jgi:hypothetical protein
MPHFEVHTLAQNRWLIDGIFFDKQTAIDDAKLLLGRTQVLDAVRVLQVEEEKSGFFEWTVYVATRPHEQRRSEPEAAEAPPAALLPPAASPLPRATASPRRRGRKASNRAQVLALVTVLALCGLMLHVANRERQPNWVWVFDRPEAWHPHELRSPWTGDGLP